MDNLLAAGSLLMLALIIWMWNTPSKGKVKRVTERQKQIKRKKDYDAKQVKAMANAIMVTGVTALRDHSTHQVIRAEHDLLTFEGIEKGYFSETVYVVVAGSGIVTQYQTEVAAQNAFVKGDYGIAAITLSQGAVVTRDICPSIVHEDNMFKLAFGLVLGTK